MTTFQNDLAQQIGAIVEESRARHKLRSEFSREWAEARPRVEARLRDACAAIKSAGAGRFALVTRGDGGLILCVDDSHCLLFMPDTSNLVVKVEGTPHSMERELFHVQNLDDCNLTNKIVEFIKATLR